jgi:predicted transcriptional regulator of viral defense system
MRTRYFGWEYVFEHICQHCDRDGIWSGDDATLADEFRVSEDEAHEMLSDLANRGLIEHLCPGTYAITKWRERYEPAEDELAL